MYLLEKICKELGVEVDEHWKGSDGRTYVIDEVGQLHYYSENSKTGGYINANEIIPKLIIGELKPKWKPKMGEYFWIVDFTEKENVYKYIWHNNKIEEKLFDNGLVFKTKEEAIKVANKILNILREE